MSEFKDDDDFFEDNGSADESGAGASGLVSLDLSEGDLSSGASSEIPVGTWLHTKIYDVTPGFVKSSANYGKPRYQISFMTLEESWEYGENRKFNVFANLFGKAFFIAYPILKAVDMAPTKEQIGKGGPGAFFSDKYADEFPADVAYLSQASIIPKGAYIFPPPSKLMGLSLWAKVTEYTGNGSGYRKFASHGATLRAKDDSGDLLNTSAYPQLGEFMSEGSYKLMQDKQRESNSIFKGDA